ncbi:MAG: molybdopterin molybdotransferase MoeA [Bacteroidota bacterium]|nr:molybdopterin molybdotransferase MoeA [Bacteroidota bacterium]
MLTVKEAQLIINSCSRSFGVEEVEIDCAFNRTLAEDIYADRDYPPFNRSAMDGFAVKSADINDKQINEFEVIEDLFAGNIAVKEMQSGQCIRIMTGAPVPFSADAVVRVEDTVNQRTSMHTKLNAIKSWQNISLKGEDVKESEILVRKNKLINPAILSALAVIGKYKIKVHQLPEVAILSTGNEIINIKNPVKPYQIRDSNSHTLKGFFKQYNIENIETLLLADKKEDLKNGIGKFLDKDILILSGGVSKGDADFIPEVLTSLGVKEIFHRVQIKPGNPIWFGITSKGKVVFALPGNPFSVKVAFKVFIEPYLRKCFALEPAPSLYFPLSIQKNKKTRFDEYFPCRLISENNSTGLLPVVFNGSGDIAATVNSDGIGLHPSGEETINEQSVIKFLPWK